MTFIGLFSLNKSKNHADLKKVYDHATYRYMETIQWAGHISLIKGMQQHVGLEPITDESDRLLIEDIEEGSITTFQEFADRYTQGDTSEVLSKVEQILNQYLRFLLELDVYHNDAQKMMSYAGICWESTKKMLRLGYRDGAIKNAQAIYELAIHCHAFEIAGSIASTLSHHYGHMTEAEELCDLWYERFEHCYDQNYWVQEAKHSYSLIMRAIRRGGENNNTADDIKPIMKRLRQYRNDAESYMYWYCYYQASCTLAELKGDYKSQSEAAKEGYEYFDTLPLDHSAVKRGMLCQLVHSYNLLGQFKNTVKFESFLGYGDQKGANHGVLALRLACAFLNIGNIGKALELLDKIETHPVALARVSLYKSYCLGEFLDDGRHDQSQMATAYLICDLYCSSRAGKPDRYAHDYLMDYISDNDLEGTREGIMIEILSRLRYRDTDIRSSTEISLLIQSLSIAQLHSTETEILKFETMIDELIG